MLISWVIHPCTKHEGWYLHALGVIIICLSLRGGWFFHDTGVDAALVRAVTRWRTAAAVYRCCIAARRRYVSVEHVVCDAAKQLPS